MRTIADKIRSLISSGKDTEATNAMVLSGGGARAAFQVGVLKYIADVIPEARFPIMTGVSAGAINIGQLANEVGPYSKGAERLLESWLSLSIDKVFKPESTFVFFRKLLMDGTGRSSEERITSSMAHQRGMADSSPLRNYLIQQLQLPEDGSLDGVAKNIEENRLHAVAFTSTNYSTGQTTTFIQGRDITDWARPNRVSKQTVLNVEHVMASAALPLIFPAVFIDGAWYGDGGVRLTTPLSPAINLGADRIFVISTRYNRSASEASVHSIHGYPPAAQVIGILMNAIFLDVLDHDAVRLERINELLKEVPQKKHGDLRPIKLLLIRPSVDIGHMAKDLKPQLSGALRLFTMGIGADETESPDWLSMLLFQREYVERLVDVGYKDASRQHDEIIRFFEED